MPCPARAFPPSCRGIDGLHSGQPTAAGGVRAAPKVCAEASLAETRFERDQAAYQTLMELLCEYRKRVKALQARGQVHACC